MTRTMRLFRRHHTSAINVVMALVAGVWLIFQFALPATHQPPILNILVQATFGAWLTNLAYDQRAKEEKVEKRVEQLETSDTATVDRVDRLEGVATTVHPDISAAEGLEGHHHEKFHPDEGDHRHDA